MHCTTPSSQSVDLAADLRAEQAESTIAEAGWERKLHGFRKSPDVPARWVDCSAAEEAPGVGDLGPECGLPALSGIRSVRP